MKSARICLMILICCGSLFAQTESAIARQWLNRAALLLEQPVPNQLEEAARALEAAAEFAEPGADALYYQALILSRGYDTETSELSPVRLALDFSEQSLNAPNQSVSFDRRAVLWSSLALRLREYRTLLGKYRAWPDGIRQNPVLIYAAARSALYLGLEDQSAEYAALGESVANGHTDLREAGTAFDDPAPASFRALAAASGQNISETAWNRYPGLEGALRPWVLSGHIQPDQLPPGQLSPQFAALLTDSAVPSEAQTDLALLRRVRDKYPEQNQIIPEYFTGTLTADADYDGYPEEEVRMIRGAPVSRTIDSDQDGWYEWSVTYENGLPWHIRRDNGRFSAVFDQQGYPSLISVTQTDMNSVTVFRTLPDGLSWEAEDADGFWEPPAEYSWTDSAFWNGIRQVTVSTQDAEITTALVSGYPVRAIERRGDMLREILYDQGVPSAGRRSRRSGADGGRIWEIYERYDDGLLTGLAWDPGMTGTPAYYRDRLSEQMPEVRIWDTDSDGRIDIRRISFPDGRVSDLELQAADAADFLPWQASDWSPWDQ